MAWGGAASSRRHGGKRQLSAPGLRGAEGGGRARRPQALQRRPPPTDDGRLLQRVLLAEGPVELGLHVGRAGGRLQHAVHRGQLRRQLRVRTLHLRGRGPVCAHVWWRGRGRGRGRGRAAQPQQGLPARLCSQPASQPARRAAPNGAGRASRRARGRRWRVATGGAAAAAGLAGRCRGWQAGWQRARPCRGAHQACTPSHVRGKRGWQPAPPAGLRPALCPPKSKNTHAAAGQRPRPARPAASPWPPGP
jgi:hypothetical protein